MNNWTNIWGEWQDSQKKLFSDWIKINETIKTAFFSPEKSKEKEIAGDVLDFQKSCIETVGKTFEQVMKCTPAGFEKDNKALTEHYGAYKKFFELCEPAYKTYLERNFDFYSFKEFFDLARCNEVMKKTCDFVSPVTSH